jgi:hypothetical protein
MTPLFSKYFRNSSFFDSGDCWEGGGEESREGGDGGREWRDGRREKR